MHIEHEVKLDFSDVLIRPKRSTLVSRSGVALERTFKLLHTGNTVSGIPIIAANMFVTGTFGMAKALHQHQMFTALHKFYSADQLRLWYGDEINDAALSSFFSLGISNTEMNNFNTLMLSLPKHRQPSMVCIDVANGYTETFVDFVKEMRDVHPNITIMAGNVVTGEMTEALLLAGADIVKVGIGSGSVCTTRKVAGVGYPQLSAVIECADAAHGIGGLICSDGGVTMPGDIAKAFGGGADFVMLGGILAGHDECDGEINYENGVPTAMKFYGMSSEYAMEQHYGGRAKYRASEGKTVDVPYRGPVEHTIEELLGGLRSACTYTGSRSLKDLSKRTTFIRVNRTHNTVFGV